MLTPGQVFHLTSDIVAIEPFGNRLRSTVIPAESTVCVVKFPCADDDRMAEVLWDGKPVVLSGLDLRTRAKEIKALTATAPFGK
jgi:hypothetical protein